MKNASHSEDTTLPQTRQPDSLLRRFDSPVLVREMRTRMRGARAYWMLTGYLTLLSLVLFLAYFYWYQNFQSPYLYGGGFNSGFVIGRQLFLWLSVTQAVMVCLITPALTSGAITIEREQRTYEMLAMTILRPKDIILGKLTAAVVYVTMLLFSSLPLLSLSFLLGGVAPSEILAVYGILFATAFLFGSIGIMWSTVVRTTPLATIFSYLTTFAVMPLVIAAAPNPTAKLPFYRTDLWTWVPFISLSALIAALMVTLTTTHLEHMENSKPLALRLLTAGCFLLGMVFIEGILYFSSSTSTGKDLKEAFYSFIASLLLMVPLLLMPLFACGEIKLEQGQSLFARLVRSLNPCRWFSGDPVTGLPYAAITFLLGLAWGVIAVLFTKHKMADILHWNLLFKTMLVSLSALAAYGAVCLLFSVIGSRYFAMVSSYILMAALILLPLMVLVPILSQMAWTPAGASVKAKPEYYTFFLNPILALVSIAMPSDFAREMPRYPIPLAFWQVTSAIHALLALAGWAAALFASRSRTRPPQPAPEVSP
ncbi:MAG: hypothetical protein IT210_25405 [Armatimonadetes bacterium]|nr:hypothetical protein [Armatimonadota bacterium]